MEPQTSLADAVEQKRAERSSSRAAMLFIIGLAFGIAAGWLGRPLLMPEAQDVPAPTPSPTADAYPGWESYTDDEYGYGLRYPADLETLKAGPQSLLVDTPEYIETFRRLLEGPGSGAPAPYLSVYVSSLAATTLPTECGTDSDGNPMKEVTLTVGGESVSGCLDESVGGPNTTRGPSMSVHVVAGQDVYSFSSGVYAGADKATVDRILASFTFGR